MCGSTWCPDELLLLLENTLGAFAGRHIMTCIGGNVDFLLVSLLNIGNTDYDLCCDLTLLLDTGSEH